MVNIESISSTLLYSNTRDMSLAAEAADKDLKQDVMIAVRRHSPQAVATGDCYTSFDRYPPETTVG